MKMRALWRHGNREPGVCRRHIYRWDLDKTYLRSEFGSFRELVRIPFEKAEDKIAAPGVAALIRALRDVVTRDRREVRIYFMSASPPQIGRAIKEKLELDCIVHDGIVFKDQLQHLVRGKFRHLREQVGFKLTELLKARREEPAAATEYLFGDDYESDPLIYSLYADVTAGWVRADELAEILRSLRVDPTLREQARSLAEQVVPREAVARIFINLERPTPPASFQAFGARLVPTYNYFQTAACLFEEGALDEVGVAPGLRPRCSRSRGVPGNGWPIRWQMCSAAAIWVPHRQCCCAHTWRRRAFCPPALTPARWTGAVGGNGCRR